MTVEEYKDEYRNLSRRADMLSKAISRGQDLINKHPHVCDFCTSCNVCAVKKQCDVLDGVIGKYQAVLLNRRTLMNAWKKELTRE